MLTQILEGCRHILRLDEQIQIFGDAANAGVFLQGKCACHSIRYAVVVHRLQDLTIEGSRLRRQRYGGCRSERRAFWRLVLLPGHEGVWMFFLGWRLQRSETTSQRANQRTVEIAH